VEALSKLKSGDDDSVTGVEAELRRRLRAA
jgi:hypothetical protein